MQDVTSRFRTPAAQRAATAAGTALWALPLPVGAAEVLSAGRVAQTLVTLAAVVGLIFALAWLARRMPGLTPRAGGEIRVIDTLVLGARERLLLIEVGGERLLVAAAPGRIERLHVVANAGTSGGFPSVLAATMPETPR